MAKDPQGQTQPDTCGAAAFAKLIGQPADVLFPDRFRDSAPDRDTDAVIRLNLLPTETKSVMGSSASRCHSSEGASIMAPTSRRCGAWGPEWRNT